MCSVCAAISGGTSTWTVCVQSLASSMTMILRPVSGNKEEHLDEVDGRDVARDEVMNGSRN